MAIWASVPTMVLTGLLLAGVVNLGGSIRAAFKEGLGCFWLTCGWGAALFVVLGLALDKSYLLDFYHAIIFWLVSASIPARNRSYQGSRLAVAWKLLLAFWAFLGSGLWLGVAYIQNMTWAFCTGLLINVSLLILTRLWFEVPAIAIQAINTLILLLVGLPLADAFHRPSYRATEYLDPDNRPYSYSAAKGDPATFARWCRCFLSQWDQMAAAVFLPDPNGIRVQLRPGSRGKLFDSEIIINRQGFRGKEINPEKASAYRIVTLGESTTFGCTLKPADKPWPELLQEMITKRLRPGRPVEVINAGIPANHLQHCLTRLSSEILPLHPDLLISYHGYNGFFLLRESMPTEFGRMPPAYKQRPLKLLSVLEYRYKVAAYKRNQANQFLTNPPDLSNPLETRYASAYRDLIQFAKTNQIKLALANFSMALNPESNADVVAFYRAGFASAYWHVRANAAHSRIVKELAHENGEVWYVDTQPGLDGFHEKFIDLVHLTQEGRQQLTENVFAAIKPLLEQELGIGSPKSGPKPAPGSD